MKYNAQHQNYLSDKKRKLKALYNRQMGFLNEKPTQKDKPKQPENLGGTRSEIFLFGDPFEHTDFSDFWKRYKAFINAPVDNV